MGCMAYEFEPYATMRGGGSGYVSEHSKGFAKATNLETNMN
jgi:hypothetical protein